MDMVSDPTAIWMATGIQRLPHVSIQSSTACCLLPMQGRAKFLPSWHRHERAPPSTHRVGPGDAGTVLDATVCSHNIATALLQVGREREQVIQNHDSAVSGQIAHTHLEQGHHVHVAQGLQQADLPDSKLILLGEEEGESGRGERHSAAKARANWPTEGPPNGRGQLFTSLSMGVGSLSFLTATILFVLRSRHFQTLP